MMFTCVKGNAYALVATLYTNNITLNNAAAAYFQDVRWVMIGIDHTDKKVAIKPVAKREIELKIVPMEQLHKVSIGKGYARISNKSVMDEIQSLINDTINGRKFDAFYDERENLLIIDLMVDLEKG